MHALTSRSELSEVTRIFNRVFSIVDALPSAMSKCFHHQLKCCALSWVDDLALDDN